MNYPSSCYATAALKFLIYYRFVIIILLVKKVMYSLLKVDSLHIAYLTSWNNSIFGYKVRTD